MTQLGFFRAATIEEAVQLLAGGGCKILAGGTDLAIVIRDRRAEFDSLVDVTRIAGLRGINHQDGVVVIGGAITFSELAADQTIRDRAACLAEAARQVGSTQIRNMGTVAGNIANGSPAADVVVPLVALNACLTVVSVRGTRAVPLEEVLNAVPGRVNLAADELIADVNFRLPHPTAVSCFVKLGRRNALSIARLSVAMMVGLDQDGTIGQVAIAVGAAAPHPFRARQTEQVLGGKRWTLTVRESAIQSFSDEVARCLGNRPSAPYKREAIKGVAWEALRRCLGPCRLP